MKYSHILFGLALIISSAAIVPALHAQNSSKPVQFVALKDTQKLSSNLVGLNVYNDSNETIGEIKDLAIEGNSLQAIVVSVGGFLGMGTQYVAVTPSSVQITYNDSDKKWHAVMNTTRDQLKGAPEFQYSK